MTSMAADPADVSALVREGIEAMPLNRLLGVRITSMSGGEARAALPASHRLSNHVGTVHSAAQYALADAAAGAAVTSAFVDLLGEAVPLAQGVEVSYLRAVAGELSASASVSAETASRVRQLLDSQGHARFAVPVRVGDATGEPALEAQTRWVMRRTGAGAAGPG